MPDAIRSTKKEIVIPIFRVGVPQYDLAKLVELLKPTKT